MVLGGMKASTLRAQELCVRTKALQPTLGSLQSLVSRGRPVVPDG
jgi:hypothetical protein